MDKIKEIKDMLIEAVYSEMSMDMAQINTHELGEVIDMIKDLSEAVYYCSMSKEKES